VLIIQIGKGVIMDVVNKITVDDLLIYCGRNDTIIRNLYHLSSRDQFSEKVLVGCWHNNNINFLGKIGNDLSAKDVYRQQILMMAGYQQFRLEHY
jgi:hypothetical protein